MWVKLKPSMAGVLAGIARPIVAAGDGVRAELDQPEGGGRAGEGLAFAVLHAGAGADHGIDAVHERRGEAIGAAKAGTL